MAQEQTIGFRITLGTDQKVINTVKELRQEFLKVNEELQNTTKGTERYEELQKQAGALKSEILGVNREVREQAKAFEATKFAEGSYRQLNAELVKTRKQFKELSKAQREGDEGATLINQIGRLDKQLKDLDKTIGQAQRNVGNYTISIEALSESFNEAAAQTGKFFLALAAGQEVLGFITDVRAAGQELQKLESQIRQLDVDIPLGGLDEAVTRIAAISTTFDKENEEVLRSANALSKQFGISFSDALGQIEDGFVRGLDINSDFLDILSEYPVQFQQAGFSAEEFIDIVEKQQDAGIFSDKGIDLVKEFGLRIQEQSSSTQEALENAFGADFTQNLFDQLNSGSITVKDALQDVAGELDNTNLPAKELQEVISNVFGAQGEDVGADFIKSLKDIGSNAGDAIQSLDSYQLKQQEILEANQGLAAEQKAFADTLEDVTGNLEAFGIKIQTALVFVLNQALKFLGPVIQGVSFLAESLFGLSTESNKASKSVEELQLQFNAEVEVLKNSNLSQEQRNALIGEINKKYKDYLPNLIEEGASLDEITRIQEEANQKFRERITLLAAEEQLIEVQRERLNLARAERELLVQIERNRQEGAKTSGIVLNLLEKVRAEIQTNEQEFQSAIETATELGVNIAAITQQTDQLSTANENATGTTKGLTASQKELSEQVKQAAENIRNLQTELIDDEFDREIEKLKNGAQDSIEALQGTPEQVQQQTDLINQILQKQIDDVNDRRVQAIDNQREELEKSVQAAQKLIQEQENALSQSDITEQETRTEASFATLQFQIQIDQAQIESEFQAGRQELLEQLNQGIITEESFNTQLEQLRIERSGKLLEVEKRRIESERFLIEEQNRIRVEQLALNFEIEKQRIQEQEDQATAQLEQNRIDGLTSEAEYQQGLIAIQQNADAQRIEAERTFYNEQATIQQENALLNLERAQDVADQEFDIQLQKNQKIREEAQRTQQIQQQLLDLGVQGLSTFVSGVKGLLQEDEKNREENTDAIKALGVSEVIINLFRELSLIAINSQQAGAAAGPAAPAVAAGVYAIQSVIAIARSIFATAKILGAKAEQGAVVGSSSSSAPISGNGVPSGSGVIVGPSHNSGGVQTLAGGLPVEMEGGEYILRNGPETYVINKKSTRRFKPVLDRNKKNGSTFSPDRLALASAINSHQNWGIRFQSGGVVASNVTSPVPVVTPSQQQGKEVLEGFRNQNRLLTSNIFGLTEMIEATNNRIDNIRVNNDPSDTLKNAVKQQENKRVQNLDTSS